jgi:hypothetical protein
MEKTATDNWEGACCSEVRKILSLANLGRRAPHEVRNKDIPSVQWPVRAGRRDCGGML